MCVILGKKETGRGRGTRRWGLSSHPVTWKKEAHNESLTSRFEWCDWRVKGKKTGDVCWEGLCEWVVEEVEEEEEEEEECPFATAAGSRPTSQSDRSVASNRWQSVGGDACRRENGKPHQWNGLLTSRWVV
jgi:hypothetical protein